MGGGAVIDWGANDIFVLKQRLELPPGESIECQAKITLGLINYFAVVISSSGDLVLVCDRSWCCTANGVTSSKNKWTLRHVPWFSDKQKRISSLAFDDDGLLYIGTLDGNIFELKAFKILSSVDASETDLKNIFHIADLIVEQLLICARDRVKVVVCSGGNGKLALITTNSLPVLITFTSTVVGLELFVNKTGLTCVLVCLQNGQNVYTVLDDLELPVQNAESQGKKSIFRKAKDNIMSKLSDDKISFFSRKSSKDSSPTNSAANVASSVVSTTAIAQINPNSVPPTLPVPKAMTIPVSNVKFAAVEDVHCRGLLTKINGKQQFMRHVLNKLDVFEGDFRQTSSIFAPSHIIKFFAIDKIFYGLDEENNCLRLSLVVNSMLKEFAVISFKSRILCVVPVGNETTTPYNVFIIAENGIHEMCLKDSPMDTCVDLLFKETSNSLLDCVCNALSVPKAQVCIMAGDMRAEDGKFAKAILFYKLAGMTHAKICAKFGSRGHVAAMLCFYELVDQERSKFAGSYSDRQSMSDIVIIGRIEQYLRYGRVRSELPRNPKSLLINMLKKNLYYSSKKAAQYLSIPELLWALRIVGRARLCYPEILQSLHGKYHSAPARFNRSKIFWELLTSDWVSVYTVAPAVFFWYRGVVARNLNTLDKITLFRMIKMMVPWRRELQRKIFTEISDLVEIIDFTISPEAGKVVIDDYVVLFITLVLEAIRRGEKMPYVLPTYTFKSDARILQKKEIANHKNNMVATMMLANMDVKSFSASPFHCACVRNGKVFTWGENKSGRLGIPEERNKVVIDTPTAINLSPSLKIYIESVSCGNGHNLALTNFGTILTWGSNTYGQLGVGPHTVWSGRPIPLDIPNVIFISIAAGGYHSVAVDHLNRVWSWGWGIHGQLGNGYADNQYYPTLLTLDDKIVFVAAGHSHTAILTCYGRVLTCGCDHFGQLGCKPPTKKAKIPTLVTALPTGTIIRLVECGLCSTVMVTTKNRLFYSGLNPATLRSLLSGSKKKEKGPPDDSWEEEKDFSFPNMIDTAHTAGDIVKVNVATTHLAVMTSLGFVYTWGLGKSGQLIRPDDDSKTLELIDCEDKMIVASDLVCAGDCTFIIEKDTGRLCGCGFNSSGQLGRMETDEEQSVMTIRTKKRVVKVRQPSNIYFRLRDIPGLPKQVSWEGDSSIMSTHKIAPPNNAVDQELLEWALKAFRRNYEPKAMTQICIKWNNHQAACLLETLSENHEGALKHNLNAASGDKSKAFGAITNYLNCVERKKNATLEQACRFVTIVINHWAKHGLPSCYLEEILNTHRSKAPWDVYLNCAIKETIATSDDSAEWIAGNLTPLFILTAIRDSQNCMPLNFLEDDNDVIVNANKSVTSPVNNSKMDIFSATGPSSSNNTNSKTNGVYKSLGKPNGKDN